MYGLKKRTKLLSLAVVFLLLSGCGTPDKPQETPPAEALARTVSADFVGFGEPFKIKESGVTSPDGPVAFEDPMVEQMLRNMIGKPEGDVLRSELQGIHAVYWGGNQYYSNLQFAEPNVESPNHDAWTTGQPQSLADFALCDNLQRLSFGTIEVPSLAPLATLTQLEIIYFGGSTVTEERLDELAMLPALKDLRLCTGDFMDWSDITDGSFLLPLADQLEYLEAMGNIDWNRDVLAQMTALKGLVTENQKELSFLTELTQLEELVLYTCEADDWSPLAALQNLKYLVVLGNQDMTPSVTLDDLRPLTSLEYLELGFTNITDEYKRQEIIDALPSLTGFYTI